MGSYVNLAYDYPVLGAFWTIMWIFLWVVWIFLLFRVIVDIFRDDSLNGWAKTRMAGLRDRPSFPGRLCLRHRPRQGHGQA